MIEFISKDPMSDQNKRVVRRFLTEVCNKGNIALIDELFACDWVGHAPPKEFSGPAELKQFVAAQRRAFPDLKLIVEDQIAEGDKVTTRWTARRTRQGIPPFGKLHKLGGTTLARLANGKIIEVWTNWDGQDLLIERAIE
jgi:ketosteroid isomerase-like protein